MTTFTAAPAARRRDLGLKRHGRIMYRVAAAASGGVVAFGLLAALTWAGKPSDASPAAEAATTSTDDDDDTTTELPSAGTTAPRSGGGRVLQRAPARPAAPAEAAPSQDPAT